MPPGICRRVLFDSFEDGARAAPGGGGGRFVGGWGGGGVRRGGGGGGGGRGVSPPSSSPAPLPPSVTTNWTTRPAGEAGSAAGGAVSATATEPAEGMSDGGGGGGGGVGRRSRRQRHGDRTRGGHVRRRGRERHALAIFPRVNGNHPSYRHQDLARLAAEPGPELDELIAQLQRVGGFMADVEDDLSVLDIFLRHLHGTVDTPGHIRGQAIVYAPFVHRTNQVGARGYGFLCGHGCGRNGDGWMKETRLTCA